MRAPLRKDAAARRTALLRSAAVLFAEQGINVPLDAIAEHAGVGRATLYRNFASRAELALAVLVDEISRIGERVADGPDAFFDFLDELSELLLRNTALSDVAGQLSPHEALTPLREALASVGAGALISSQAAGRVRSDIQIEDIRLIAGMLGVGFRGSTDAERRAANARTRSIVLAGLRPAS